MAEISYARAIREAMAEEMRRDDSVLLWGEDVGAYGGVFGVTRGLYEEFGPRRVIDTPIAETFIVGAALGAAITGLRPIVELQFADFVTIAGDEMHNKLAKWRYMHGGHFSVPVVVRAPCGALRGSGAEHSQCPEGQFLNSPGIKVVMPSTPFDAKGLMKAAIRDDNPVLFLEHKGLYRVRGEVPEEDYVVPLGQAEVKREGTDVTVIALSAYVRVALAAAEQLAAEGISVEVVDPRTLVPLDRDTIFASVEKTGRVVIVHEAPKTGGAGAELAALIAEERFYALDSPPRRVAGKDVPLPQSHYLESFCLPTDDDLLEAVRAVVRG